MIQDVGQMPEYIESFANISYPDFRYSLLSSIFKPQKVIQIVFAENLHTDLVQS